MTTDRRRLALLALCVLTAIYVGNWQAFALGGVCTYLASVVLDPLFPDPESRVTTREPAPRQASMVTLRKMDESK